jgi:hypothetical protein
MKCEREVIRSLVHSLAEESISGDAAKARLRLHFRDLFDRLRRAVASAGADPVHLDSASHHPLCAEALAEVLEERVRAGVNATEKEAGEIIGEYHERVAEKFMAFAHRGIDERARIAQTFPGVNFDHIELGLKHAIIEDSEIAPVMEDLISRRNLMRKLLQAGLL